MFKKNNKNKIPPPPKKSSKPIQTQTNNQQPSLLSTLGQGMAWGTGTSLGHSLFNGIFGNSQKKQEELEKQKKCEEMKKYYNSCLQYNHINYDTCDFIKKDLKKICDNM